MSKIARAAAFPVLAAALRDLKARAEFGHFLFVTEGAGGVVRIDVLPLADLPPYAKAMEWSRETGDGIVFVGPSGAPVLTSLDQVGAFAHWTEQAAIAKAALDRVVEEEGLVADVETLMEIAKRAHASVGFAEGEGGTAWAVAEAVGKAVGIPHAVLQGRAALAWNKARLARSKYFKTEGEAERAGLETFVRTLLAG